MLQKAYRLYHTGVYRLIQRWDSDFTPIFICGIAGSGTTLLTALLDQKYKVAASLPESALASAAHSSLRLEPVSHYPDLGTFVRALPFAEGVSTRQVYTDSLKLYRAHVRPPKLSSIVLDKAPNTHLMRAQMLAEAFPAALFLLIVRNPVTSIEGLRRKWPLFQRASIDENCDYWERLHLAFLKDSAHFSDRWLGFTYDDFIQNTESWLDKIAVRGALVGRDELLPYADEPNDPGKGLRNVKGGKVEVDPDSEKKALRRLSSEEESRIQARLAAQYAEIQQAFPRHQ